MIDCSPYSIWMKNCLHYISHLLLAAYFILFLTVGDLGFWLYAHVYLCIIKDEISETIEENMYQDSLDIITVANTPATKHDLSWTEEGKEFSYRGEMYDVIKTTTSGDSTRYFCIKDARETNLRHSVDQHVKNENASSPAFHRFDFKVVMTLRKTKNGHHSYHDFCGYAERNIRHHDDPDLDLLTPPPKSC